MWKASIKFMYTKGKKEKIWEATDHSASLQSLEKIWIRFSWKLFLGQ